MKMSKIGSKVTYHRCLKNLNHWSYICYFPSHNPFKSSQIKMLIFCTSSETSDGTSGEQVVVPIIKDNKQIKKKSKQHTPKNEKEVLDFFKSNNGAPAEAVKFFCHYSSVGWRTRGKQRITNWHGAAKKWILNAEEFNSPAAPKFRDNLKTTKSKDYDQPL